MHLLERTWTVDIWYVLCVPVDAIGYRFKLKQYSCFKKINKSGKCGLFFFWHSGRKSGKVG